VRKSTQEETFDRNSLRRAAWAARERTPQLRDPLLTVIQESRALKPLKTLWTGNHGKAVPLPVTLKRLYGHFRLPQAGSPPYIFSNFVTTLDGVVSLRTRGHANGGDISGFNAQDRMVMGLLRAVADVVIVGSGTLAADSQQVWTPEAICPELAPVYGQLRKALGKSGPPLNVIVSGSGSLNLRLPVFSSGQVQVKIITTAAGAKRLAKQRIPHAVEIRAIRRGGAEISARRICSEVCSVRGVKRVLVEGGPRLLADFFKQRLVSEQFLTLAPQIAGRVAGDGRLGMVMGKVFAPRNPLWGKLVDVRQGASHLFLRYSFT
jgi:riboflavin biosynthesis pyrimidine reductase